jgi:hypothetical protein
VNLVKISIASDEFQKSLVVYFGEYKFEVVASLLETRGIHPSAIAEAAMVRQR